MVFYWAYFASTSVEVVKHTKRNFLLSCCICQWCVWSNPLHSRKTRCFWLVQYDLSRKRSITADRVVFVQLLKPREKSLSAAQPTHDVVCAAYRNFPCMLQMRDKPGWVTGSCAQVWKHSPQYHRGYLEAGLELLGLLDSACRSTGQGLAQLGLLSG